MKLFITGTDTNVGKTYISVGLLQAFNQKNYQTIGSKLIASGCNLLNDKYVNEDALKLQNAASIKIPYSLANPFALPNAIAPHLAAEKSGQSLSLTALNDAIRRINQIPADIYLFEGIGGWYVPLNHKELMSDVVAQNDLSVILVVGMRLGCLNHAILTMRAFKYDRVKVIGWIANCVDESMQCVDENIATLKQFLSVPFLGVLRYQQFVGEVINVEQIVKGSSTKN